MSLSTQQLRRTWFQLHKWLGLVLAILIIPVSLSGAALVWHDGLDELLHPQRHSAARPSLAPSAYAAAAGRLAGPGERLISLAFPEEAGAVVATLARAPAPAGGRPVRTMLYLDPASAELLDRGASNAGLVRQLHILHGSLMVPGIGRQLVGWIGVAMLVSALTGLWLWWPLSGGLRRGLRWRRQPSTSGNLHHQGGFWVALPLAVLSLTGAWISFPAFFAGLSDDPAGPSQAERMRRQSALPLAASRLTPDQVLVLAAPHSAGPLAALHWPTERDARWRVGYRGAAGPSEVQVDDRSARVTPPQPPRPETSARLMRRIHDGTGMGLVWQTIIFAGGIVPAVLAVTGVLMWLRVRRRARASDLRRAAAMA